MKPKETNQFVGVDLGKLRDRTALAVLERIQEAVRGKWTTSYQVLGLIRVDLGTAYADIAEEVRRLVGKLNGCERPYLVVDATGVGVAVVEMIKAAVGDAAIIVPVVFTGGAMPRMEDDIYYVPKRQLVEGLIQMLERGEVRIAGQQRGRQDLFGELDKMRVKLPAGGGREKLEAWRESDHDDMVFALALACWHARRTMKKGPPIDEESLKRP